MKHSFNRAWSRWDMLEINAQAFMNAVMRVRQVQDVIDRLGDDQSRATVIEDATRLELLGDINALAEEAQKLFARTTLIAINMVRVDVINNTVFTFQNLSRAMADIESRLRDELGLVRIFVLDPGQSAYLLRGEELMGQIVADRFPSLLFEMEEAATCIAMGRSTASAFHSMRALEGSIKAFAKFLSIPDPTKPAERNWGSVLRAVKTALDEKYSAADRLPSSEGATVEALYASLDAVKNPWRNATMHVETIYQPHEAAHIIQCVNLFILKLADLCDEDGVRIADPGQEDLPLEGRSS